MSNPEGKRKSVICLWIASALILAGGQMASAQDYQGLLNAMDRLEGRLKAQIDAETATRQQQVNAVQQELADIRSGGGTAADQAALETLQQELAQLKLALENLSQINPGEANPSENQELLQQVMKDIDQLKAENMYLRSVMENSTASSENALLAGDEAAYEPENPAEPAMNSGEFPVEPEESPLAGIELSGFFDAVSSYQNISGDKTEFGFGQAEIDLESALSPRIGVAVAVAYNADDGIFELGAAELGFNLYSADEGFLTTLDLTAGQFDIPFGIDYLVVASPDRKLVTAPQVVCCTHDDWNDYGVRFGLECAAGNLAAYVVNGFASSAEVLDEVASLALGEEVYEEIDTSPANAFGTRLGATPLPGLEFGTSFASGINHSGENEMLLWGTDLQWSISDFELTGEWIVHSLNRSVAETNNRGWYAQGVYNILEKAFVVGRYGSFKPDGEQWIGQMSIGAGYRLLDGVELRWESQLNENTEENNNIVQAVVSF